MGFRFLVLSGALLVGCASVSGPMVPVAGVGSERGIGWFARTSIDAYLKWKSFSGDRSGFVALFARDGRLVHSVTAGYEDLATEAPMRFETRMRMASMTKPVTAVAAMILLEEGKLRLEDPVGMYLPAFGAMSVAEDLPVDAPGELQTRPARERMTVRHLLSFTSGLGGYSEPKTKLAARYAEKALYAGSGSLADRVDRISALPLYEEPGTRWRYGWSHDVLARVIEIAAGEPFGRFLERRIFRPLGMNATSFLPPSDQREGMATLYTQNRHGRLVESTKAFDAVDWTPGGSGLVSTAPDYLRFALMLWNEGEFDGVRILRPETVELMQTPVVHEGVLSDFGIEGLGFGLGVAVTLDEERTPMIDRNGDYFWDGAYNTHFWISPRLGLVGVVLTQNQQSEYSEQPAAGFVAQALAISGAGD